MDEPEIVALARRFSTAICARDMVALDEIYSDDMTVWKVTDAHPRSRAQHLATYPINTAFMTSMAYVDVRVTPTRSGFVQQHTVIAELADGGTLRFACCMVVGVRGGRIATIEEYFDSAAITVGARPPGP